MNCDICQRPHDATSRPFLCAVDARNCCYEFRVRNLQALFENDSLRSQIAEVLGERQSGEPPNKSLNLESFLNSEHVAKDKASEIAAHAGRLKTQIATARSDIDAKRTTLALRRADLAAASSGLAQRRARQMDETEASIQSLKAQWNRSADGLATTRAFLCMEAAKLYGLRRIKKGASRYEFKLGGVDVVDLAAMNTLTPEAISTSLAHIAHLLMLVSHYLSIRLPAEITLPRRDYPRPTIFNTESSYRHGEMPFPSSSTSSLTNFHTDSGHKETHHVSRPRPLFIDKPLPTLAKEDPSGHSFFLEGVTLLAYDVAWLCLSQNVPIGDRSSFDDVCHMGRNLYNLLIGQQLHNNQAARIYPSTSATDTPEPDGHEESKGATWMGRYSHGTTHSFLGSASGADFVRKFKLPVPIKLADRLKRKLMTESTVPEWEVLENDAWEVEDAGEEGVVVPAFQRPGDSGKTHANPVPPAVTAPNRPGHAGWTKIKGR